MKNPITPSWWELNNRSLPVHDPYELARAVAERFAGTCKQDLQVQPTQQKGGGL